MIVYWGAKMTKYEIIQRYCKLKGVSVAQMERDLDLARGSIAKIDDHVPNMEKVKKICEYLNMPLNIFLDIDKAIENTTVNINGRTVRVFPQKKKNNASGKSRNELFMEMINDDNSTHKHQDLDSYYYLDPQAAELAKEVFERDELKVLFDAVKDVPKEDIETVIRIVKGFKNE